MAYKTLETDTEEESEEKSPESGKEPKSERKPDLTNAQWWRAKELGRKPHEILDNVIQSIEGDQQSRYEAYKEYDRLFGSDQDDMHRMVMSDTLTQNELQNTIETLWAQIFKNRVVPAVSVSETDWDEWDRARSYSRWLEGAFDEGMVYEEAFPQAGINFLKHGTGIVRIGWKETDDDTAALKYWSVSPRYVTVDRLEARHGKPRSMFFKDHVDKYTVFDTYCMEECDEYYGSLEERAAGVNRCQTNDDQDVGPSLSERCEMLTVREAYHLPSSPKAKDGRHVIWVKGCTLVDEEFTWDRFPCVLMRFGARGDGFWGESALKRLAPTQKLLDKLNAKIDECQDIMGVPRILAGEGSGLKPGHLDDIPGGVVMVTDINQVKEWNAQCATQELYADRDGAPKKMRSLLGISDFEATAQLPPGLRDVGAPFMERFIDQGTARNAMSHAEYENAIVALSYLSMLQAEDLQEMGYDVVCKGPSDNHLKSSIEELNFKDVHVDRKRLKLKVQPMSQLPQSFPGKVDAFQKLMEAGYPIDQKTVLRMLEVPDLAGETDMLVSDEEIIMKNLSHMCRTGEYLNPMPFDNLDLIIQLTTRYINRYRVRKGADYNKVGLMAQYIDDAIQLKKGLGGPDPNAPPPAGMPPVSDPSMGAPGGVPGMGMGGPPGMPPGPMGPGAMGPAGGPPVVMSPPQQMQVGPPNMPPMQGPPPQ